jgi:hypothetical protein
MYYEIDNYIVTVRDNSAGWTTSTRGIGDCRGCIVAQIPFQSNESKAWAIAIANQIINKVDTKVPILLELD